MSSSRGDEPRPVGPRPRDTAIREAERMKTVGQLASSDLAHELATPLNVVAGRARLIARGHVQGVEAAESAQVIAEQAQRMIGLVRAVLTYARRRPTPRARVELGGLATLAVSLLLPSAHRARVGVRVEVGGEPLHATGDSAGLEQVLVALLHNAIQATEAGGEVVVLLRRDDEGRARIRVADSGPGIDPAIRGRLFEPFFTTREGGAGLGLAVADAIVRAHGGAIEVELSGGPGAVFEVVLPEDEAD